MLNKTVLSVYKGSKGCHLAGICPDTAEPTSSASVGLSVCLHTCVNACMHICSCTDVCMCMRVQSHMDMSLGCVCTHMHMCIQVCTCVCMHASGLHAGVCRVCEGVQKGIAHAHTVLEYPC